MWPSYRNLIALGLLLIVGALGFYFCARENGRSVNTDVSSTDQGAYIKYGMEMRKSDFAFVGGRNRMPLYPALLASFMDRETTKSGFFETGKLINIWLSLVGLAFVGLVFFGTFSRHHALNALGLTAFGVFVFKAAYVQSEILYYLLTFAVFLLGWQLFRWPRWGLALVAGGLVGLTHLTKASILPGLVVFLVFYPGDALWQKWRNGARGFSRRLMITALVTVAFLAAVLPYISKSKEVYGQYFYNVNSTFYIWCESWKDVERTVKAAGDREGWPDLPPEEIPSFKNYLRDHSAAEIGGRVATGISRVFNTMARGPGFLWFGLAYVGFAAGLAFWKRRVLLRVFLKRPLPTLALLAYFLGYGLLMAWYSQIIQGNRFVLALFLPFLFTLSVFLVRFSRRVVVPCGGFGEVPILTIFNTVISIWLLVDILITCLFRISSFYGGS